MDVLKLLQSKNRCLKRFLSYSQTLLDQVNGENFSTLEYFLHRRDVILKVLDLYDRKILDLITRLSPMEKTTYFIDFVKKIENTKETLIQNILETDRNLTAKIEEARNCLLR